MMVGVVATMGYVLLGVVSGTVGYYSGKLLMGKTLTPQEEECYFTLTIALIVGIIGLITYNF